MATDVHWGELSLWLDSLSEEFISLSQEQGIRQIVTAHPEAIIEIPVDFLAPLICTAPDKSKEILEMFRSWGVNRFAISWEMPSLRRFFDQMDQWGYEINIYDVPDLEAFLRAVLLMPRAITSNFNFPKWHYYGQGSHDNGRQRENSSRQVTLKS